MSRLVALLLACSMVPAPAMAKELSRDERVTRLARGVLATLVAARDRGELLELTEALLVSAGVEVHRDSLGLWAGPAGAAVVLAARPGLPDEPDPGGKPGLLATSGRSLTLPRDDPELTFLALAVCALKLAGAGAEGLGLVVGDVHPPRPAATRTVTLQGWAASHRGRGKWEIPGSGDLRLTPGELLAALEDLLGFVAVRPDGSRGP